MDQAGIVRARVDVPLPAYVRSSLPGVEAINDARDALQNFSRMFCGGFVGGRAGVKMGKLFVRCNLRHLEHLIAGKQRKVLTAYNAWGILRREKEGSPSLERAVRRASGTEPRTVKA